MMNAEEINKELSDILSEFGGASSAQKKKLAELAKKAQKNKKALHKSLNDLQESLDYLRVCIKYQLFDLEATNRENEELRKLLFENGVELP